MKFRVIIGQDEDGVFIAQCPAFPGCVSQGQTRKEAEANIKEAVQGYIESLRKHDEAIPPSITEEIIDITI
ncbi:MAG: type II toxin-antitoxin system HicB family antitoxin [Deltaproteobacteria bacterium]